MNKAYQNMRAFWLDARNMQSRQKPLEIGPDKIITAGVEMAVADGEKIKHVLVVTNSLGDSSFYFENNSPSGLGGIIGGHNNEPLQQAAAHLLAYAGKLTPQMTKLPVGTEVPAPAQAGRICLLAAANDAVFYKELSEEEARKPENPFYPMFAFSQQAVGCFQAQSSNQPPRNA